MQFDHLKRREFITLLSSAAAWPLAARAQQPERMRHIGVLMNTAADNLDGQARFGAFLQGLQKLGWADGRNVRIDVGWAGPVDIDRYRKYATELVARAPLRSIKPRARRPRQLGRLRPQCAIPALWPRPRLRLT
jgi:hypothetical protein